LLNHVSCIKLIRTDFIKQYLHFLQQPSPTSAQPQRRPASLNLQKPSAKRRIRTISEQQPSKQPYEPAKNPSTPLDEGVYFTETPTTSSTQDHAIYYGTLPAPSTLVQTSAGLVALQPYPTVAKNHSMPDDNMARSNNGRRHHSAMDRYHASMTSSMMASPINAYPSTMIHGLYTNSKLGTNQPSANHPVINKYSSLPYTTNTRSGSAGDNQSTGGGKSGNQSKTAVCRQSSLPVASSRGNITPLTVKDVPNLPQQIINASPNVV